MFPVAAMVVNAPVEAVLPPIGVLFIEPVVIAVPEIVPPVIATPDEAKLLAVTKPAPNVTGLFVVVSMDSVPVEESITGELAFSVRLPLNVVNPEAARVVNVPVEAVVAPIGAGEARYVAILTATGAMADPVGCQP
jgi:hypothetical protein